MTTIHFDPTGGDDFLRERLYAGDLVVFSPSPATARLVAHARAMLEEAFAPHDPLEAQHHLPVERFVEIFAALKPRFIHDPVTLRILADIVAEKHLDVDQWFVDVPRLRGVTSHGYLTSGVGYAHHPHRDTWYSAPMAQLNWWMPVYPYESGSSMSFHPAYWDERIENGSPEFNYYEWNATGRKDAAKMITADTRKQPKAEQDLPRLDPEIRLVTPVGGLQLFSASHLHATVANDTGRTRFSVDFRTVHLADLRAGRGAHNVDSWPTGTSLRDFRRASDLAPMPEAVVAHYDLGSDLAGDGVLVFAPGS